MVCDASRTLKIAEKRPISSQCVAGPFPGSALKKPSVKDQGQFEKTVRAEVKYSLSNTVCASTNKPLQNVHVPFWFLFDVLPKGWRNPSPGAWFMFCCGYELNRDVYIFRGELVKHMTSQRVPRPRCQEPRCM